MKTITAEEFDRKFDDNEDISEYLNFSNAIKLSEFEKLTDRTTTVNINFPEHILMLVDKEAQKIGITRQAIIKVWIAERLQKEQEQQLIYTK